MSIAKEVDQYAAVAANALSDAERQHLSASLHSDVSVSSEELWSPERESDECSEISLQDDPFGQSLNDATFQFLMNPYVADGGGVYTYGSTGMREGKKDKDASSPEEKESTPSSAATQSLHHTHSAYQGAYTDASVYLDTAGSTGEDAAPQSYSAIYCYGEQHLYASSMPSDIEEGSIVAGATANASRDREVPAGIPSLLSEKELNENQWNRRFQVLFEDYYAQRGHIAQLVEEFALVAESVGRTIISELHFPKDKRTIHPLQKAGKLGIAGGQKYLHEGIFFKFAADDLGIYGNDEFSQKAAGHELRGLNWLFSAASDKNCLKEGRVSFPIMTLIDFRGHRLVASSLLPIGRDTIVYGSDDAGVHVHNESPEMNSIMGALARSLNLKAHPVKEKKTGKIVELEMPIDLEGHLGRDGRFYLIDTHRVCPPEPPIRLIRGCHLVRLLRPELVEKYECRLSADAFSTFSQSGAKDNAEVFAAVKYLREKVIPEFSKSARRPYSRAMKFGSSFLTDIDIVQDMHRAGINARYLGMIYDLADTVWLKTILLREMISRTMKQLIRLHMRQVRAPHIAQYHRAALIPINLLFNQAQEGKNFVNSILKRAVLFRFVSKRFSLIQDLHSFLWEREVLLEAIFRRIQLQACLVFTPRARSRLVQYIHKNKDAKNKKSNLKRSGETKSFRHKNRFWKSKKKSTEKMEVDKDKASPTTANVKDANVAASTQDGRKLVRNAIFRARDIQTMYSRTKRFAIWLSPTSTQESGKEKDEEDEINKKQNILIRKKLKIHPDEFTDRIVIMHGMTGVIFSARWHRDGGDKFEMVAITLYHTHMFFIAFVDAAPALVANPHPNLVNVLGVSKFSKRWAAVTEYVGGGSLESVRMSRFLDVSEKGRAVNWRGVIRLALDVARGLYHLHSLCPPIMHRNVTPPNVLFDKTGRAKLNVVRLTNNTQLPSVGRSRLYNIQMMGSLDLPESKQEYTEKSDVCAYGRMLLLLCKQLVHRAGQTTEELPPDCPPLFDDLLQRCVCRDPARRPTTAEIVKRLSIVSLAEANVITEFDTQAEDEVAHQSV